MPLLQQTVRWNAMATLRDQMLVALIPVIEPRSVRTLLARSGTCCAIVRWLRGGKTACAEHAERQPDAFFVIRGMVLNFLVLARRYGDSLKIKLIRSPQRWRMTAFLEVCLRVVV